MYHAFFFSLLRTVPISSQECKDVFSTEESMGNAAGVLLCHTAKQARGNLERGEVGGKAVITNSVHLKITDNVE